jgi:predicted transcriptional regulator
MNICKYCNGTGVAPDHKVTGGLLRGLRQEANLSLREMAELAGYSHSFLSQLENGKRSWSRSVRKRYEQVINQQAKDNT